ncbi:MULTISPECIES: type II toxin-antitoxin system RelE/ParE family toxin [unclassified Bartonella]|uniref:type II toxin-antitoxin system RelE/ParE family toxin n=1 Tax=unclassified Bartonella TaxID=2645622 RepID=UPI00235E06F7|nr:MULTISPECIES: type II toxin-antitoxin system RelE/ParE family toxin [unclassified Bartonella]
MFIIKKTSYFNKWLNSLRDKQVQKKIAMRILRLEYGLLGDVKFFNGIGELRIHYGAGYRIYFVKREKEIILLLNAGDKSTQQKDIEKALQLVKEIDDENNTI